MASTLGLRALKVLPQFLGLNPMSKRAPTSFGQANEFNLPVICHTGARAPFALPSLFIVPARDCPELPIVLGHCGSPVYFQEGIIAAQLCPNIHLGVSSLLPHQVLEVLRHVDASRVMPDRICRTAPRRNSAKIFTLDVPAESTRQVLWSTGRKVFDEVNE